MQRKAILPFIILAALYSVVVGFIYACYTLWYSDIPERALILQRYMTIPTDLLIVIISLTGMIAVIAGGAVMYRLELINRTWLTVYAITPILTGIMLVELFLLFTFQ